MAKMQILIIADGVWSDVLYGNNVSSNWFNGFHAEFAEIYCSPGTPKINIVKTIFRLQTS
jgi:hypothetical protein